MSVPVVAGEEPARARAYLHAGHLLVSAGPTAVTTILGSCVAVCLWDPRLRAGGLNHFLLPHWVGNGQSSPRFGNVATARLVEEMLALGSRKPDLQAKVFGGASVLAAFAGRKDHLGMKNVDLAMQVLAAHGIPVVARDVGGERGRKLIFHTDEGVAWVKVL